MATIERPLLTAGGQMVDTDNNHSQNLDVTWENGQSRYQELMRLFEGSAKVKLIDADLSPEQEAAFREALYTTDKRIVIECIDEGMPQVRIDGQLVVQIGVGGAGALGDEVQFQKLVDFAAQLVAQGKEVLVRSHQGCGAAKLAQVAHGDNGDTDAYARTFGEKLTTAINQKNSKAQVIHSFVSSEEMTRPDFHNAIGAYVSTIMNFNPTRELGAEGADELPPAFNIVATYGMPQHTLANIEVAADIALGSHGFGARFSAVNPFLITIIEDSSNNESDLRAQDIKFLMSQSEKLRAFGDRIKVVNLDVADFAIAA